MSDRPFILILEGPDGCGKTSLARALFELDPDTVLVRSGPPKRNAMAEYEGKIKLAFEGRNTYGMNVVIDRLHVGEMVYGPILRGCSSILPEWFEWFEERLDHTDIIRAFVTIDDWEQHRERLMDRDGGRPDALSGVKLDQIIAVRDAYERLIGSSQRWSRIDTSIHPPKTLAKALISTWMHRPITVHEAERSFAAMYQQNQTPEDAR